MFEFFTIYLWLLGAFMKAHFYEAMVEPTDPALPLRWCAYLAWPLLVLVYAISDLTDWLKRKTP